MGTANEGGLDFEKRDMIGELGALLMHSFVWNHRKSHTVERQTDASSFWCIMENTVSRKKYRNTNV